MRLVASIWLYLTLAVTSEAHADQVPTDEDGFTSYVRQTLQLYTPKPVKTVRPFEVEWTDPSGEQAFSNFRDVYVSCQRDPKNCEHAVNDYVQAAAREMQGGDDHPAANPAEDTKTFPGDEEGFMTYVVTTLGALMPESHVAGEGRTLTVTRPSGQVLSFDIRSLHGMCEMLNYQCSYLMEDHLSHMRDVLTVPDRARLHVELLAMPEAPYHWDQPTAYFFQPAFENLEELCVKEIKSGGNWPMLNADRHDFGMKIDEAIALCEQDTHKTLIPIVPSEDFGSVSILTGRDVSAHALFPADWAAVANQSAGHFLMAVPTRDTLLFMIGDGKAQVDAMAAETQRRYSAAKTNNYYGFLDDSSGKDHRVGDDVYRWNGGGWERATSFDTKTRGAAQAVEVLP